MDDIVVPTGRARSLVHSFLARAADEDQRDAESDSEGEEVNQGYLPRQERLGVGAVTKQKRLTGNARVDQKLSRELSEKKRRRTAEDGAATADAAEAEEPDDSRTQSLGRRRHVEATAIIGRKHAAQKPAKKKKRKVRSDASPDESAGVESRQESGSQGRSQQRTGKPEDKDDVRLDARDPNHGNADQDVPVPGSNKEAVEISAAGIPKDAGSTRFAANARPKKKKVRSRQKNLKRDKRSADQKPSYLTDETLLGGRLPARSQQDRAADTES